MLLRNSIRHEHKNEEVYRNFCLLITQKELGIFFEDNLDIIQMIFFDGFGNLGVYFWINYC